MSIQPKSKGGARPGAGRKPDALVKLRKSVALGLLTPAQETKYWKLFLTSTDENIALKAFLAWNERAFGKTPQPVQVDGELDLTLVIDI
jgi:hypothetical protein